MNLEEIAKATLEKFEDLNQTDKQVVHMLQEIIKQERAGGYLG